MWLVRWLSSALRRVRSAIGGRSAAAALAISGFSPAEGWPGTRLEIQGSGFDPERDGNTVTVNGAPALLIEATPGTLRVLTGEATTTGSVAVSVGGVTASSSDFTVLGPQDAGDTGQDGPPAFFDGPQQGTPQRGVQNQAVLVVLCYPTDHDPGNAAARQTLRDAEIAGFSDANRFWTQASYGTTSWAFSSTDWLALPGRRDDYMWQQEDVDRARQALLGGTTRSLTVQGGVAYAGRQPGTLAVVDVGTPAAPFIRVGNALAPGGPLVTGVRIEGTWAYVTAGFDGLYVLDVSTPNAPTVSRHLAFAGWLEGLDVRIDPTDPNRNLLAVAARDQGLWLYHLGLPGVPVPAGSVSVPPGAWATAVRLQGDRAYVAAGDTLRVVDVAAAATPAELASVATGAWVMGVDVSGTLCAVATDGDGVHLYDVTNPVPAARGVNRAVVRTHAVDLDGGLAYVAAGDGGLRILDVSNPMTPTQVGQLTTAAPAYDVVVVAGHAYLSSGADTLAIVDVTTPATPAVQGSLEVASPFTVPDPDLTRLRDDLSTAQNLQALTQRRGALMVDAFRAAQSAGHDLNAFHGLIVVVNGPFLRGQSWTSNQVRREDGTDSVAFTDAKGLIYMATNAHWGRKAHEIGHWLGMWDIYTEWFADGTLNPGTAAPWDLAGNHDLGPLFSGHQIHQVMQFFQTTMPNDNVVERTWSPTAVPMNETFDIVAHDAVQDVDPARVHLLKLIVAQGLVYFVEVRQRPVAGGVIFDQQIPVSSPEQGVVLVTRATEGTTISNTQERPIQVFGAIGVGQRVVDAARRLTIEVMSKPQDRPLIYRVRVEWNQPDPADPNAKFDLSITPWSTATWETVDIWVDSPRNSQNVYEFHEPGQPSKPILNGDRPWVHRTNKIFAKIRNTGGVAVSDAYVTFYVNSPPGIGDNGSWGTLGTRHLPTIPARDPAVPDSGTVVVDFDWIPALDKHTCLKVAVLPKAGEIEAGNNSAQENVAAFDSAGGSSHQPVVLEAEVRSPFVVWRRVDVIVRGLPAGWHAAVDHAWVWVPPGGTKPISAAIWTDIGTPLADRYPRIPTIAHPRVEGWTDFDHRYLPIGGILAIVKATRRVDVDCQVTVDNDQLFVSGCLRPPLQRVPITVEITDGKGRRQYVMLSTDATGCFDLQKGHAGSVVLPKGTYTIQVFVTAGGEAAQTECDPVTIEIR